ncbi:b(0,+)-type amino acid transporter 1-like isoform X2 [Varroa jacobsoni]|uniref:b(0,+)-type amino acid transporter 1-like isoform X2 n=1 Tax=Varroa jacobsoni TaxID=62625 RepID=UPI000BF3F7CE|nr:b(0,+)-type amino acid transporter 1-like isoform X2 [Varroa jacobsoni]
MKDLSQRPSLLAICRAGCENDAGPSKEGADGGSGEEKDTGVRLERNLGLMSGVAMIVGTMIGSGIFVSPKGVLLRSGSVGMTLVVWAGGGFISLLGALSFAELGTLVTKSGGDYIYILEAFRGCGVVGPVPAFLYAWTTCLLLKPASLGITTQSFAKYMLTPFFLYCEDTPTIPTKMLAIWTIILVTIANSWSVTLATRIQNVFTLAKIFALVCIIAGGLWQLALGRTEYLESGFEGTSWSFSDIASAFYSAMWAYDGWNNLNLITEELIDPFVNLPRAIIIGIPLVTTCYVFTNLSYLTVLSRTEFLASEAVAVRFGNHVFGSLAAVISLFVAASTFGSANGSTFAAARISFTAAREGHQLKFFSYAHVTNLTPMPALILNAVLGILMVVCADIGQLIDFFGFAAWMFYGIATFTVISMRFTKKDDPRPYKVPICIPVLVCIVAVYLVVAPIVMNPQMEYVYASVFILSGILFYVPFVHFKCRPAIAAHFTKFGQIILNVVPTISPEEEGKLITETSNL